MQLTTSALTLLAAAAMVQASCIPLITCSMKRDVRHPHARDVHSGATPASPESIGKLLTVLNLHGANNGQTLATPSTNVYFQTRPRLLQLETVLS